MRGAGEPYQVQAFTGAHLVEVCLHRPSEVFRTALHAATGVPDEHQGDGRFGHLHEVLPRPHGPGKPRLLPGHRAGIEALEARSLSVEEGHRGPDVRPAEELKGQHRGGTAWHRELEVILFPQRIDHPPGRPAELERIGFGGCPVGLALPHDPGLVHRSMQRGTGGDACGVHRLRYDRRIRLAEDRLIPCRRALDHFDLAEAGVVAAEVLQDAQFQEPRPSADGKCLFVRLLQQIELAGLLKAVQGALSRDRHGDTPWPRGRIVAGRWVQHDLVDQGDLVASEGEDKLLGQVAIGRAPSLTGGADVQ
jgi:hypothetical protein